MNRMDDLIGEIKEQEAIALDGCLGSDAFKRIEQKVIAVIRNDAEEMESDNSTVRSEKKHLSTIKRKKRLFVAMAAVFIMIFGVSVYAAKEKEWDITLLNFMGINNVNTFQLENGVVEINQGQKSTCIDYGRTQNGEIKEIEMIATTSIGDQNEVYIRIETDYELPDDFDAKTDYVLPGNDTIILSPNKSGYGATFTYFEEDNRLGFLMSISDCEEINKAEITLGIENLYWYHDLNNEQTEKEKELLCEGTWELKWKYQYQSNTKTRYMLRPFLADGVTYFITKVEVSPISIRMEAFRMPWNRNKSYSDLWLEEIHFTDGTVIQIDNMSGSGMRNGMFAENYVGVEVVKDVITPKKVEKVVIQGEDIWLR